MKNQKVQLIIETAEGLELVNAVVTKTRAAAIAKQYEKFLDAFGTAELAVLAEEVAA